MCCLEFGVSPTGVTPRNPQRYVRIVRAFSCSPYECEGAELKSKPQNLASYVLKPLHPRPRQPSALRLGHVLGGPPTL